MELLLINDSKLKIVLTSEDMKSLDITCDSIDYDSTGTRRVFWELLDRAKQQTGFDAASQRIYIQVYPDRSGGCYMYVTKLSEHRDDRYEPAGAAAAVHTPQAGRASGASHLRQAAKLAQEPAAGVTNAQAAGYEYEKRFKTQSPKKMLKIYYFENSDHLCAACGMLSAKGWEGMSDIYARLYGEGYYMLLEDGGGYETDSLSEFGKALSYNTYRHHLGEYCKKLTVGDGVDVFAKM